MYGAGDALIGQLIDGTAQEGKRIKREFLSKTPALKRLREDIQNTLAELNRGRVKRWKRKYLKGLDGRHLPVRSLHSALNLLLQSAGALICKKWIVETERMLVEEYGLNHGRDFRFMAWIHDETQCACLNNAIADLVINTAQEAMRRTQEYFKFRLQLDTEGKKGKNWKDCH